MQYLKNKYPPTWISVELKDVRLDLGKSITPNNYPDVTFELYSVPACESGFPEYLKGKEINSTKKEVFNGSVLLCKINPRINRVWIVGESNHECKIASTEWIVFNELKNLNSKYLLYFFTNQTFREYLMGNISGVGGSLTRISPTTALKYDIPLPPLAEQHRIVEKIEEEFTRLDAGVAALKRAKALIPKYRQSVLKSAMCGDLTKEWRALHPDVESAEVLVEIRNNKKLKLPEIDNDKLPDVPQSWKYTNFSNLISKVKRGPSKKCNTEGKGIRYITSGNLRNGKLYLEIENKYLDNFEDINNCILKDGDLILNCVNSFEQIGKSAVFKKSFGKAIVGFNNYALELSDYILPSFSNYYCQTNTFKEILSFLIKRAVNQVSFAKRELDYLPIPLPPLEEQHEIVSEIERRFSIIDEMERVVNESLLKAERLRQSVLKKAFEGRLVSQNPDDEPAGVLLERIQAEKELRAAEGKANGKKKSAGKKKVKKADAE